MLQNNYNILNMFGVGMGAITFTSNSWKYTFQNQRYILGNIWVGTGAVTFPKLALYTLLELPQNHENACLNINIAFL